eukprot:CAMPEP_0194527258 /NCGR_PEP_ID=MMETSP0253-20130528/63300_1 /TAXON_ID=2966 /ORGANISM="Noctiluca scintillans" /LENGTH=58 /DNA_ID=CAMNT_0039372171 /DNA_START=612 /DNA_END=788 /DNA_ORIENTATION=+
MASPLQRLPVTLKMPLKVFASVRYLCSLLCWHGTELRLQAPETPLHLQQGLADIHSSK